NAGARLALSQVASARGWPRKAEEEAEIAAGLDPLDLSGRLALVETDMANYRFAAASAKLARLLAQFPENQAVQRLKRDLDAQRRFVLELEARPGNSNGGGANASGQTLDLHGRLSSPPLYDHWRLFVLSDYSNARPPEGFVQRTRGGAGVEW